MFFCLIFHRIFPKFPSLTFHGNFPETFRPFATLVSTSEHSNSSQQCNKTTRTKLRHTHKHTHFLSNACKQVWIAKPENVCSMHFCLVILKWPSNIFIMILHIDVQLICTSSVHIEMPYWKVPFNKAL